MNNPYQAPMMNNPYIQSQNPYMDRMNFLQNYQQSLQQPMQMNQRSMPQQIAGINGRIVQAVENINANEVPMDGSMAFFPKQDMSEIYVKGWNADGTIRKYRVEFNGNIAVPDGGTAGAISLAIAIEGEPDLSTLAISTPTATESFNNVSMATDVWLPCGCCQAISVKNTSTQEISVANANITVNRIG